MLAVLCAASLGSAAAAQPEEPHTTFTISDHDWYALHQTVSRDGTRVYEAFGNVRRLPGNRIRYYSLMFASTLTRVLALETEVDCGANTLLIIAGGGAGNDIGYLFPEIASAEPQREGTTGWDGVATVCGDEGQWRPVSDPMAAGRAHLAGPTS